MTVTFAMLLWQSQVPPLAGAVLLMTLLGWLLWTYRRYRVRRTPRTALLLTLPRALILLLLARALFDPVWSRRRPGATRAKASILLDGSASMHVPDSERGSRQERARAITKQLRDAFAQHLHDRRAIFVFQTRGWLVDTQHIVGAAGRRIDLLQPVLQQTPGLLRRRRELAHSLTHMNRPAGTA